jgi:hypothetical protein
MHIGIDQLAVVYLYTLADDVSNKIGSVLYNEACRYGRYTWLSPAVWTRWEKRGELSISEIEMKSP